MPPATLDDLAPTRQLVEQMIGRPLRRSERAVDVLRLTGAMDEAKRRVANAVRAEVKRRVRKSIRSGEPLRLAITPEMLAPLEVLFQLGVEEAQTELRRAGYEPGRSFEDAAFGPAPLERRVKPKLKSALGALSIRIEAERVRVGLDELASDALVKALLRIPGAQNIASQVVSTALYSGMGQTFEENSDVVSGWARTAILDAGTCDPCAAGDGTEYATWEDAQDDMPNGGPASDCDGGDRCRCRLVAEPR